MSTRTGRRRLRRLGPAEEVPLTDHLEELRNRIFVALLSIAVAFGICFWRYQDILDLLNRQLPNKPNGDPFVPITIGVGEAFTTSLAVSLYAALLIALPIVFYQAYAFVIPAFGEGTSTRRMWPLLVTVPLLFTAGVVFAYLVVLPAATTFLLNFGGDQFDQLVRAKDYYGFVVTVLAAFGVIFEMPAAVLLLARAGIVSSRMLRTNRRIAVVVLTAIAAALPGVDPVTMLIELVPLLLLFEISIWCARLVEVRRPEAEPEGLAG